jgi:hypothetical protein
MANPERMKLAELQKFIAEGKGEWEQTEFKKTTGINLEDSPSLDVVWPNEAIRKCIGEQINIAESLHLLGQSLPSCAKLLVECLIEGKLTETELKDAQEALQRGDTEPDRAILQRLTRKGIDL